jgi:sarcosine oxidase
VLIPELASLAIPERQVVLWTEVEDETRFTPERFPVFNLQATGDDAADDDALRYYGFPSHRGLGFKIGKYHHLMERGDPDKIARDADATDEEVLREAIRRFFPQANGARIRMQTCLFTNTPDKHFILDTHPRVPAVAIAAGFSGHGFKFCSVVGEVMADLATGRATPFDITPFALGRNYGTEPGAGAQ